MVLLSRTTAVPVSAILTIVASKLLQLAADAQPLLYIDSGPILLNGWHLNFPERAYIYGRLIRYAIGPFGRLEPLVVAQALAGAATAIVLLLLLQRRVGISIGAALAGALLLAWDPAQVVHERLVMTECAAGLAAALYLWISALYIAYPRLRWLVLLAVWGVALVSLRVVYVPLIWAAAGLIPLVAHWGRGGWKPLGMALLVGAVATGAGQMAYRGVTGALFQREPAYHYRSGFFLLGNIAALVRPEDAVSAAAAAVVREQAATGHPPSDESPEGRNAHLWKENGMVARMRQGIPGEAAAERESRLLALNAIRRDPAGFLRHGLRNLAWYRSLLGPVYREEVSLEDGYNPKVQLSAAEWRFVGEHFASPVRESAFALTPSRAYHQWGGAAWGWLALLAPALGFAVALAGPQTARRTLLWIAVWSTMLLSVTVLFTPVCLRYLHPLSFPAAAAVAVIGDAAWRGVTRRLRPALWEP